MTRELCTGALGHEKSLFSIQDHVANGIVRNQNCSNVHDDPSCWHHERKADGQREQERDLQDEERYMDGNAKPILP